MFLELKKKKAVFDSFKPFSPEFKTSYENLNLLDFAFMNLKLDGSNLTKEGVNEISRGNMIDHVPLFEHRKVENHKFLLRKFYDMIEMDMELDEIQLIRLYKVLTGNENVKFRENGTMLYHLDYMPPHSGEIQSALGNIFIKLFKTDFQGDFIRKAVSVHNRIIEVYPFENESEALARTAMEYELIRNGMPIIPFELNESDYNSMLSEYLKTGDSNPLYENLIDSAYKKFDILLALLREEDMKDF